MLKRDYRLRKKSDFKRTYSMGKSYATPFLVLYVKKRDGKGKSVRIGFSVSKRLGNAVVRNKLKRRLRAGIQPILHQINQEYDLIFIAREKIKGISFQDVEKNILNLLKRSNLYSPVRIKNIRDEISENNTFSVN